MAAATFRVLLPGEPTAGDVLGLWDAAPGDEPGPVWEVDVSGEDVLASLQQPARQLDTVALGLPDAERRLQRFVQTSRSPQFAFAGPAPSLPLAERRLAALVAPVEVQAFALGGLRGELDEALRRATDFAHQVRRIAGQAALVRSSAAGRPLGRTRVGWGGDVRTAWAMGLSPADVAVHDRAVQLALATFHSWLRIIILVGTGAVQLSLLLPSGIGAITALPAAWRFITDILAEYQRLRALPA
jgi:hypothetical protein